MKSIGKRSLAWLLSILLTVGCCVVTGLPKDLVQAQTLTSADYQYTVLEDGTAEITGYSGSETDLAIPAQLDGHPVTKIGNAAFINCSDLVEVIIPQGVTSIGNNAFFHCDSLTSITIPQGVTKIEYSAFQNCTQLTNIVLPDTLTAIGEYAFAHCTSLANLAIPTQVNQIGYHAFDHCESLERIAIPDGMTEIPEYAFGNCYALTEVSIPNSVVRIGDNAFTSCVSLSSLSIPESVTDIGSGAFSYCSDLSYVELPQSVSSLGVSAFFHCESLSYITIPKSITRLEENVFAGSGLASLVVPDGVTSIGPFALEGCSNLTSVVLPDSVTSIQRGAFQNCSALGYFAWPDSVTAMEQAVFAGCSGLTGISIPDSVASIGQDAFQNAYRLRDVYYWGTESQWQGISQADGNSFLQSSTIHYNSTGPDTPSQSIVTSVTLEEGAGKEVFFSASGTDLPQDQVSVASQDEAVVTALLQSAQTVSSVGPVPMQTMIGTVYLQANQAGETNVVIRYPGGEQTIQVTVTQKQVPQVPADFQESIYHADHLLDSSTPGNWSMEATLGYLTSQDETPSRIFLAGLQDDLFQGAITAWEGLDSLSLAVRDPAGLVDKEVEIQDLYSAIILQSLRASLEVGLSESVDDSLSTADSIISQVTTLMKTKYNLDVLGNKMTPESYAALSTAEKIRLNEDIQGVFDEEFPLTVVNDFFSIFNLTVDLFDSIESYVEYLYTGASLMAMSDATLAALQEMYRQCPASNYTMRLALQDCIRIMNSSAEELIADAAVRGLQSAGWQVATYLVDELWGSVMALAQKVAPGLGWLMVAYDGAKLISNGLFNTDATITAYYKMRVVTELEEVACSAYRSLSNQYRQSGSVAGAEALLSCSQILFQIMDSDCVEADSFVEKLDQAGVTILSEWFGCENNYDALRNAIQEIRNSNDLNRYTAMTNWINYLEEDYPGSGMYEAYAYRFDQELQKQVHKEYRVACPVDVFVYDNSTNGLVASVIGQEIQNNDPENLTVIRDGEEKVLWMAQGTDYRIVLVGSDVGTMDITVKELDENQNAIRTVSYDDIILAQGKTYETRVDSQTMVQDAYQLTDTASNSAVPKAQDTLQSGDQTYTLQVNLGLATVGGQQGSTLQVTPGQLVTITAYLPEGESFLGWSIQQGGGVLADASAVTTTFRMPNSDVVLTANVGQQTEDPLDLNGDGKADSLDLMYLAQKMVDGETGAAYDFNQDGDVDVLDLMVLAQRMVG